MNLIQVQERLKDLPLQAVMAYANGSNPDVPPYVALGEMQRRKRVQQEFNPAQAPTGTVKDQLEATVSPGMAPTSEAPPELSGIASVAAQPGVMQPGVMRMAGGGIVAFARGGEGDDEDESDEEDDGEDYGGDDEENVDATAPADVAESYPVTERPEIAPQDLPSLGIAGPGLRVPPQMQAGFAQRPQAPMPVRMPQPTAQQLAGLQSLAAQQRGAAPTAPESPLELRARLAKEQPEMFGLLNKPVGQDYLTGLQALQQKQAAMDPQALARLQAARRGDFWKSLIAAGEATRGQKGLGALFGGFGRAMIPAMEARAQEEAEIQGRGLKREKEMLDVQFKVDGLRRAQQEGDLKSEQKYKQDLFGSAVKAYVSGNTSLAKEIAAVAGIREAEIRAAAQVESARIRANKPATPAKATDLDKQYKIELDALIAAGEPDDAATRKKAMNAAQYQIGRAAGTIRAEATAQERADDWLQQQILTGPKARELRKLRTTDPARYEKEIKALEEEARQRYSPRGKTPGSPAPTSQPSTPAPPPGFDPE